MANMRMLATVLESGHLYIILEGGESDINTVRRNQNINGAPALTFRIVIRDSYGMAYREHLVFEPREGTREFIEGIAK
jgi:hypothetical protein